MSDPSTPLKRVVPADTARKLASRRGIETVGQLLWFLPRRYLDPGSDLGDLTPGDYVVFVGTVLSATTRPMRNRRGKMLNATVSSGGHEIDLTFFKAYGHEGKLVAGATGLFAGAVSRYGRRWQLAHPAYELYDADDADDRATARDAAARPRIPVYREVKNLPSWTLGRVVGMVLDTLDSWPDPVPDQVRERRDLPGSLEAFRMIHAPANRAEELRAARRLKYDEALTIQVALAQLRHEHASAPAVARQPRRGGLLEAFDARLPFRLTAGQASVGEQIAADLSRTHPMHRLLQGEVGSGKTVVALRAMLAVVDAGGQAAMLAPTEVLAAQHHRSITAMLGGLAEGGLLGGAENGTRVALLTGSQSTAQRKRALLQAASGEAGIVVGTHALIQDIVTFADLGLVVVDEQHRFGVTQRDALRGKAREDTSPHVLVMTATPIPRTVAMTVFGDMETSALTELPSGRSPIASHVVGNPAWYERAWQRVAEEVAAGHQAYVVCPRIGEEGDEAGVGAVDADEGLDEAAYDRPADDGDDRECGADDGDGGDDGDDGEYGGQDERPPLRSVLEVRSELRARPELAGLRVEMLHGRMPAETKDAVMTRFAAGEVDVLVSTTVIEVGVDVPNATVMVVMDADRFGVSQLHQLRGRVGRGGAPGLCLLVTRDPSPSAAERLATVAATTDGFELARLDLTLRREGDILGARQSGTKRTLRMLRLGRSEDEQLIAWAREDAATVVDVDPDLRDHPALASAIRTMLDEERAAFLERG